MVRFKGPRGPFVFNVCPPFLRAQASPGASYSRRCLSSGSLFASQSRLAILPVIAMAEGERWVRRDYRYGFPLQQGWGLLGAKPNP